MDERQKSMDVERAWAIHQRLAHPRTVLLSALRERVSAEQNHRCCYCGIRTNEARSRGQEASVEHIIPRSKGGPDQYWNCVMACHDCNVQRGHGYRAEHRALLPTRKDVEDQ